MIEALGCLLLHLFAAFLMAFLAIGLLALGVIRSAWLLFCWPGNLIAKLRQ